MAEEFFGNKKSNFPAIPRMGEDKIKFLQTQEGQNRQNNTSKFLRQFRLIKIKDANGQELVVLAIPGGIGSVSTGGLWGLTVTNGNVKISNPGTVAKNSQMDSKLTIANINTEFTPADGKFLYLETSLLEDPPEVTLKIGDIPTYPDLFSVDEGGGESSPTFYQMDMMYYPLWKFVSTDPPPTGAIGIGGGLSGVRYGEDSNFKIQNTTVQDSSYRIVTGSRLISSHRVD